MPEVKAPPVRQLTDIELFAKAYLNIELTSKQLEMIALMATGRVKLSANLSARAFGKDTVQKVIYAYLQAGLSIHGRERLPAAHVNHLTPLQPREKAKGITQEGRVLNMIKRPGGAFNFELSRYALKYTSVISELRKDGHNIVAERQYLKNGRPSNTWKYYLNEG